jgi:hypothetical protein
MSFRQDTSLNIRTVVVDLCRQWNGRRRDVFSSEKCWKERSFMREGDAAGTVADLKARWRESFSYLYHGAYWHGALYVRCEEGFAMRYTCP